MALIQFTKNHTDHSTDKGYQFEFFCDRCGNGFMSKFKPSVTGPDQEHRPQLRGCSPLSKLWGPNEGYEVLPRMRKALAPKERVPPVWHEG